MEKGLNPLHAEPFLPESKKQGGVEILHYFPYFFWAEHILVLYL